MSKDSGDYSNIPRPVQKASDEGKGAGVTNFQERYRATLEAGAVYQEAQRIEMLMNYADVKRSSVQSRRNDLQRAEAALAEAKLKVMQASVRSLADLAIKVLVAAEDGFQSRELNRMLEQDARRIITF